MKLFEIFFLYIIFNFILLFNHINTAFCSDNLKSKHDIPYLVAIDIGHSKSKCGATSSRGIGEYWFNNAIGIMLHEKLNNTCTINAILINKDGLDLSLSQRVTEINASRANLLISIHHDSVQPQYLKKWTYKNKNFNYCDTYSGYSIFISKESTHFNDSHELAEIIGKSFLKYGFKPTLHHAEIIKGESRELLSQRLGIYNADFSVLTKSKIPAILIECGIITNRNEELKLKEKEYQNKISELICNSIFKFIKENIIY